MGGACSQKLKSRRGLPSSSGRFCIGWDAATLTQDPIGQQKPASPGLQLVGEIHYCWGGSNLGWVISAKRPSPTFRVQKFRNERGLFAFSRVFDHLITERVAT